MPRLFYVNDAGRGRQQQGAGPTQSHMPLIRVLARMRFLIYSPMPPRKHCFRWGKFLQIMHRVTLLCGKQDDILFKTHSCDRSLIASFVAQLLCVLSMYWRTNGRIKKKYIQIFGSFDIKKRNFNCTSCLIHEFFFESWRHACPLEKFSVLWSTKYWASNIIYSRVILGKELACRWLNHTYKCQKMTFLNK